MDWTTILTALGTVAAFLSIIVTIFSSYIKTLNKTITRSELNEKTISTCKADTAGLKEELRTEMEKIKIELEEDLEKEEKRLTVLVERIQLDSEQEHKELKRDIKALEKVDAEKTLKFTEVLSGFKITLQEFGSTLKYIGKSLEELKSEVKGKSNG